MTRILFVCLGNICRSPTAEGIMDHLIETRGLSDKIETDSAGTSGYHQGEPADIRAREAAQKRAYTLKSKSRMFTPKDFDQFDYIITMDHQNQKDVLALAPTTDARKKVHSMMSFCSLYDQQYQEVPDPYHGGMADYKTVLDLCEDGCKGLLDQIEKQLD